MLIIVQGKEVETKDIVQILSSGNKEHGFIIQLSGERFVKITQPEEYNMYDSEKGRINDRYRALRAKVEEKWNEDKTEFTILNL